MTIDAQCQVQGFTIYGEPASKANSRRLVSFRGKARFIKSKKALDFIKQFQQQIPSGITPVGGDLKVTITIFYASRRPDLDESLILDAMQGFVYANDRQVKEKHIFWRLDRANPRSEIRVEKLRPALQEGD